MNNILINKKKIDINAILKNNVLVKLAGIFKKNNIVKYRFKEKKKQRTEINLYSLYSIIAVGYKNIKTGIFNLHIIVKDISRGI